MTQKVYNRSQTGKDFVDKVFRKMSALVTDDDALAMVISTGDAPFNTAKTLQAERIAVFTAVPQISVLQNADLFFTHGGANSVNEAALAGVPMLVLPFFDDQHFCAKAVEIAGLGKAIEQEDSILATCMSPLSGIYDRTNFTKEKLKELIPMLLSDEQQCRSKGFQRHAMQQNCFGNFMERLVRTITQAPRKSHET